MSTLQYSCPLAGCGWRLDVPPVTAEAVTFVAAGMGVSWQEVAEAFEGSKFRDIERQLGRHMATHKPEDWLVEFLSLQKQNLVARTMLAHMAGRVEPKPDPLQVIAEMDRVAADHDKIRG